MKFSFPAISFRHYHTAKLSAWPQIEPQLQVKWSP